MKKFLTALMVVLSTLSYSQLTPGVYNYAKITVDGSGTIVAIDSAKEVDPTVDVSVKGISNTDQDHWNSGYIAYQWGNPNGVFVALNGSYNNPQWINGLDITRIAWPGLSTQYMRADGTYTTFPTIPNNTNQLTNGAGFITGINSSMVNSALGYTAYPTSNPAGYISSYTETDPTVPSFVKSITNTNISNWNTAFSWGNHAGLYPLLSGSYTNPNWLVSIPNSKVTYTGTTSQYVRGDGSLATLPTNSTTVVSTLIAMTTKSLNTSYTVSATQDTKIYVSASVSCNLSLSGGQDGSIILEVSPNGSTGWVYVGQIDGSNTGTLTIGLNTTQKTGAQLIAPVKAGYFWRLRTVSNTGTPTFTWNGGSYEQF